MNYLQRIPFSEFTFQTMRSRGPGGQHVNRTNSAVVLVWRPLDSQAFNEQEKWTLQQKLNLNNDGELLIRTESERSQDQNKSTCLKKLEVLLQKAFFKPKQRIKTKPTRGSKQRKQVAKTNRSEIKTHRKKVTDF